MKQLLIPVFCLAVGIGANAQDAKSTIAGKPASSGMEHTMNAPATSPAPVDLNAGKFKFSEETHDLGEVMEGPLAECDFEFKNVGKKPIIIAEAHGSCGCTVPKWPTDPIMPKQKAVIHVSYNTAGRVGVISKDVIITSNAVQSTMKLHITGMVKARPAENRPAMLPLPPPPNGGNKK